MSTLEIFQKKNHLFLAGCFFFILNLSFLMACAHSGGIEQLTGDEVLISQISLIPVSLPIATDTKFPNSMVVTPQSDHSRLKLRSVIENSIAMGAFAELVKRMQNLSPEDPRFFRFSGDFLNHGSGAVKISLYFSEQKTPTSTLDQDGFFIANFTLTPRRVTSIDRLNDLDTPVEDVKRNLVSFFEGLTTLDSIVSYLVAESEEPIQVFGSLSLIGMPPLQVSSL